MNHHLNWLHIYGVALLCGVGYTMSLFIGSLAFENTGVNLLFDERLGIIVGSLAISSRRIFCFEEIVACPNT